MNSKLQNVLISFSAIVVAGTLYDLATPEGNLGFDTDDFTGRNFLYIGEDEGNRVSLITTTEIDRLLVSLTRTKNIGEKGETYVRSFSNTSFDYNPGQREDRFCSAINVSVTPEPDSGGDAAHLGYWGCANWPFSLNVGGGFNLFWSRAKNEIIQQYDLTINNNGIKPNASEANRVIVTDLGISAESH